MGGNGVEWGRMGENGGNEGNGRNGRNGGNGLTVHTQKKKVRI